MTTDSGSIPPSDLHVAMPSRKSTTFSRVYFRLGPSESERWGEKGGGSSFHSPQKDGDAQTPNTGFYCSMRGKKGKLNPVLRDIITFIHPKIRHSLKPVNGRGGNNPVCSAVVNVVENVIKMKLNVLNLFCLLLSELWKPPSEHKQALIVVMTMRR